MMKAQIQGIDYYLPERILDNEALARIFPEWTAKQIEAKTGVLRRHLAAPDETATDMAVKAAQKLLSKGVCNCEEIDFVIFCTQSPDYFLPTSACLIQKRLGLSIRCGAFDFNLGCSGYIYGLALAQGLIESGAASRVLLLTAETYSRYLHPQDRSVRAIFGDAASATLIGSVDLPAQSNPLIGPFVFGTDGNGAESLIVKAGAARCCDSDSVSADHSFPDQYLYMDGPAIFSFTLKVVPTMVNDLLAKSGFAKEEIGLFVFHQANKFILDALCKQSKIDPARFVIGLADKGNTVSCTIPIALADTFGNTAIPPANPIMLVGFGVGLSWAGALVSLPVGI
jgi:3-oxoacyl-[acyl-carrier-protein] synthase III